MSLKVIETQILKFLSTDEPEVLAIKGSWGIGKTYSWNKFLLEAKDDNQISLQHYSYVSLFGINSLDSFKYSIYEHIVNQDLIGSEANLETFKNNTTNLLESMVRKSYSLFKDTSLIKNLSPAFETLSFLMLLL